MIDDNMSMDTLVSLRRCKDGLKQCGGLSKFQVTKNVLAAVRGSRMRYEKDQKSKSEMENQNRKRKNQEEISIASAKIKRLSDERKYLSELADKKARECKNKSPQGAMKLIGESNALRDAADGKQKEICEAEKELEALKTKYC